MSSSKLPTPSLDEIETWDENRVFEHFQHPALGLKPVHVAILQKQEVNGKALVQLTEKTLSGPLFNLPGGSVVKIMGEIARLQGVGQHASPEAISQSAADARIKKTEAEIEELKQKIELVTKNIIATTDENEKDRLCKELTELHEREWKIFDILKGQLRAPPSNFASIVQGIKHDTEETKNDTEDIKIDTGVILSSLDELHSKVDSLPKLMLDRHEDTVPRLFFIFPEDGHWSAPSMESLFTKRFRLYFLCEHEIIENGSTKKQFHLAYHDGYPVIRPREFVAKYGSYIHMIMPCLILAVRLGRRLMECVPAIGKAAAEVLRADSDVASTTYKATELSIFMERELAFCVETEIFFKTVGDNLEATDKQVTKYTNDAPSSVHPQGRTPGLMERPDLRELQAYLEGLNNANRLGNLQRVLRHGENGSTAVRWVCKNHASEWETTTAVLSVHTAIKSSSVDGGVKFDDENWELTIRNLSRDSLRKFRNSVLGALSGVPLRKISFVYCEKADSEDVEALVNAATTIEILKLKYMANMQYKNILSKCLQLRELDFSDGTINDREISVLAEALKMNISLPNLNLESNRIGEKGASALAEALKMNMSLQNLNLWNTGIGEKGTSALAEALKMNTNLQDLNLRNNGIGEKGASALAETLKMNKSLQNLNLEYNGIGEKGASSLAEALKMNTCLQNLNLEDNGIGEKGAGALAEALKMNTSLQDLNLRNNGIGEKGASALAEVLKMNTSLQDLNLRNNEIGEKGACALAEALKMNTNLQNLNIERNDIDDKGASALAEALKLNTSLQNLNLEFENPIGEKGQSALREAQKVNKVIRST